MKSLLPMMRFLRAFRYVSFGYFVDGTADFDAAAFRMPPGESMTLDPQARIALEQTQVTLLGRLLS